MAKNTIEELTVRKEAANTREKAFKWEFSLLNAPHRQGFIEAIIKSVKRALNVTVQKHSTQERKTWEKIACEITFLLNWETANKQKQRQQCFADHG